MQAFLFKDAQRSARKRLQMFAGDERHGMFAECLQAWMASKNQRNDPFGLCLFARHWTALQGRPGRLLHRLVTGGNFKRYSRALRACCAF